MERARQRYLNIDAVASRFGVRTGTIYRLVQQGRLPGFKIGGQWRFSDAMLETWVADRVAESRKDHRRPERKESGEPDIPSSRGATTD